MQDSKKPKDDSATGVQKFIGIFIIAVSVTGGMYFMDRFPGMQLGKVPAPEAPQAVVNNEDLQIVFIKDWSFPTGTKLKEYEVGGLSALAYDNSKKQLVTLSDDRGGKGDSRFFKWDISFQGQVDLKLSEVVVLKNEKKKVYPERTIDPEGLVWVSEDRFVFSSEGEQEALVHQAPRVVMMNAKGEWIKDIPISKVFWDAKREGSFGIRNNMGFEALSLDPSRRWLYLGTESALHQDGDVADFEKPSLIRIAEYDREGEEFTEVSQIVYPLDPIPAEKGDKSYNMGQNGVSDFISLSQRMLLVMERAYLANRGKNINRLFLANCLTASDVKEMESLKGQSFEPCKKKLVFEFDSVLPRLTGGSPRVDNLEGMVLWVEESTSKRYLMFVADNNFRSEQSNQFMLFEVQGGNFE